MERTNLPRNIAVFLACGAWAFWMLALASFSITDWPSHAVWPYPPTQNLCGLAGAFVAYHCYVIFGAGVYPLLFFTGLYLIALIARARVTDLWLRVIGLLVLTVVAGTFVSHFWPGGIRSLPEGNGGIVGIGASHFLAEHFNSVGSLLVLAVATLVGLLLTADDLVLRVPGAAVAGVKRAQDRVPTLKGFKLPPLPRLPSLPGFVTKDAAAIEGVKHPAARPAATKPKKKPTKPAEAADDEAPEEDVPEVDWPSEDDTLDAETDDVEEVEEEEEEVEEPDIPATVARPEIKVKLPSMLKPRQTAPPPPKELGDYEMPAWDDLEDAEYSFAEQQEEFVREKAAVLQATLQEFGIDAHVVEIDTGPVITMYELSLGTGVKVSAITGLSNDIARALKAEGVRIVAPVPGKNTVGIESPNAQKEKVRIKELMQLAPEKVQKMAIPLFLGKDASGEPLITDLAAMPHCLIAGTTGSGKSVCINTIILSIMYTQRPDRVKLILIDPKVVEMAPFKDIPHLMAPVITETGKAQSVLDWACEKMDERYNLLAEAGVRNIKDYNNLTQEELLERYNPQTPEEEARIPKKLPYIVIIIDELADLMMTAGKEVENYIVRIAQKARAVGIHLIVATQRPQATVVTGLIKSNLPSKIAFRVSSKMDSRIVLDQNGAELLLGQGDMLFLPPGASKPVRSQGTYISDKEISRSVKLVKSKAEAQYEPDLVQIKAPGMDGDMERDELFDDAVRVVLETKRGSVSLLQRRLTIGYSRASRLIEQMAEAGLVGEYKGSQAREATISLEEWDAMKAQQAIDEENGMSV
ncbi:MAG: DNA translocase FtsK [Phycisphaerae bacterium]